MGKFRARSPRVTVVKCSFYWLLLFPIKYYLFSLTTCIPFRWRGRSSTEKVAFRFCFICGIQEVATDVFCCSIFCMSNLLSHGGPPPKRYYLRCFVRAWRDLGSSPGSYLSLLQCPVLSLLASSSHPPLVPPPRSWNRLSAWWNGGSWWGLLAFFAFFFFFFSY